MTSGNRMFAPAGRRALRLGGSLEDHLQLRVHVPAGRSPMVLFTECTAANTDTNISQLGLARYSFTGNTWRQFVLRVGPCKTCSRRYSAFFAGSHGPRLEAESRAATVEYRHSLRSRTALGAVKRTLTARDIVAVRGGVENQSRRIGSYQSGRN